MREYLGKKALFSTVLTAMLVLGGCSSSDGNSSGTGGDIIPTSTASGLVVDGYIANGHLYADVDASKDENTGDINTTTDAQGNFSFGETTVAHGTYLYLYGGTDLATNTPFAGELSAYFFGEMTVVTPLSTLIVSLMQNEGLSYDAAVTRAAAMMGLSEEQVVADPMIDPDVFVASQRVVAAATTLGGDFSVAVDAIAASDMNVTGAAATLGVPADDALAVDAFIVELLTQIPSDATADDLAAYQLLIVDAVNNPTAIPDVNDAVAVANALGCVTFDAIKGSNTAENNITTDLVLNSCESGDDNVSFTWSSDNTVLLSDAGVVASPVYVGGDVNLNVTITSDANASVSTDKTFALSIPRLDNHPPVATGDVNTTAEETMISFNILANDTDADGDALTLVAVSNGVGFNADGTVTYTPAVDFNGDFVFTYTVRDSWNAETNGTVTITVTGINDAPVLDAIDAQMLEEDFALTTLEINATDVDSGSLFYSVTAIEPAIVNASFGTANQLELTSIANLFGDTNITVMVSDGDQNDSKTFTLTVAPVDDAPVIAAIADPSAVDEDAAPLTIGVSVTDVDSLPTLDANSSDTSIATAVISGTDVVVTPVADAFGTVTITVSANDAVNPLTTQTFSVTINPVNDAPVITSVLGDLTYAEDFNPAVSIPLSADDVDGDAVTYSVVSTGAEVNATITGSGTYNLRLESLADAFGDANITVSAHDGNTTSEKSFILHITPVNDAPIMTAIADIVTLEDSAAFTVELNATDVENDALIFTASPTSNTIATLSVTGTTLTITPKADANGGVTITVQTSDGEFTDVTSFDLNVTAVNDDPTANDFTVSIQTGSSGNLINLASHIGDVDGDSLSVTSFTALDGLSHNAGTTTFTYDNNGSEGIFTFDYTVEDGQGGLPATATVSLNVSAAPIYPVAVDDNASTDEEVAVNIAVLANDTDGIIVSNAWVSNPANGTVQIETNNTITFTPATDKAGIFLLGYTAQSATGHEDNATVSVRVFDVNDAPVITFTSLVPLNLNESLNEQSSDVSINVTDVDTDLSSVSISAASDNSDVSVSYSAGLVHVVVPPYVNGDANITVTADDGQDSTVESFMVHVTAVDSIATITTTVIDADMTAGVQSVPLNVMPVDETYTLSIVSSGDANIAFFNVSGYTLEITPNAMGTTSIVVRAINNSNNALESNTTITVHVYDPNNVAPEAYDGNNTVNTDEITYGSLSAFDANGDTLTYTLLTLPAHGAIVKMDEWGNYTYAAMDGYVGEDTFTFIANDSALDSNVATVTIAVTESTNVNNDNGVLTEKPISVETYNAYTAIAGYGITMYSVWEEGWGTYSDLQTERLIINESPQEIELFHVERNETEILPYTLGTDNATLLMDFDSNGTIDFEAKYLGTVTKEELENDLNLTLPVGATGYKLASLQLVEEYNEWDVEYRDWNCSVEPCVGSNPYSTLSEYMTDKTFDPATPSWSTMWIDGYGFKFAEGSDIGDMNGTIVRTATYWDGSTNVEIVTNANAGTWELVDVNGQEYIKVTPAVYGLDRIVTYTISSSDSLVHSGEYYPPNRASLEYKFDETTMYYIGNSIMNRVVGDLPSQSIADASGEFLSFNSLATLPLLTDTPLYGIWTYDNGGVYTLEMDTMTFDSNGTFIMDGSDGFSAPYTETGGIATIYDGESNPFADGKFVREITDPAELSILINIPEENLTASPLAYQFAHVNYNAELDIWNYEVVGLDGSTTYTSYSTFEAAFINKEVVLDYTLSGGGIGFADGTAGVGGTLAEYDYMGNVITANAGTWEVVDFNGKTVLIYTATVNRYSNDNAIALSDISGTMSHGQYNPVDSGTLEYRFDFNTADAIRTYLLDLNASGNPEYFEVDTKIMRDVEAVAFTNDKMYRTEFNYDPATCERNVTTPYIWMDGNSANGNFVISDVPDNFTYISSDGKIATVTQTSSGNEVYMVKVNEEINASELMSETSLFLPASAHGYRISYMDIATGIGGTEIKLDADTILFMETYFWNNHNVGCGSTLPLP